MNLEERLSLLREIDDIERKCELKRMENNLDLSLVMYSGYVKTTVFTYMLHFENPVYFTRENGPGFGDKYHYIGKSTCPSYRLKQHRYGYGSTATKHAFLRNNKFKLGYFYKGDCESSLSKILHMPGAPILCKICLIQVLDVAA